MKTLIRKLIQIVLVLPIGSDDVEHLFSIMNHICYRRSRMTPKHVGDLLRIRIIGLNVENFILQFTHCIDYLMLFDHPITTEKIILI